MTLSTNQWLMHPSGTPINRYMQSGKILNKTLMGLGLVLLLSALSVTGFLWSEAGKLRAHPSSPGLGPIILARADELLGEPVAAKADLGLPGGATAEPRHLLDPQTLEDDSAHLCFFSLNNPWEYRRMRWFTNAINKHSPIKIKVSEFQVMDTDPVESFEYVLRNGIRCDGVVLSGHFTDEYYGDRADGDLRMKDLERLSCKPGFSEWFSQVNALWLQGCNTIKYTTKNEDVDDDDRISGSPLHFMARIMDPEDMEDSIEDMYDLLLENINEENFAIHFQRIFPSATVFGWTNAAPGEKAGSDRSIPYHIAQSSRVIDADPRVFSNPITSDIPPAAARRYAEVLYGMLKRPLTPRENFPADLTEKNFIQAWRDHGSHRYRYAFDNPSVRGYAALSESDDEVLRQVKGLACLKRQIDDMDRNPSMVQLAQHILRDRNLYEYSAYTLDAMLKRSSGQTRSFIHSRMQTTDGFMQYLERARSAKGYRGADARRLHGHLRPATPDTAPAQADKQARSTH